MKFTAKWLTSWVAPPLLLFLLLLATWQLSVILFKLPAYLVPGPFRVLRAGWIHGHELLLATAMTGAAALAGFLCSLLGGFVIAFGFSQSSIIRRSCYPYAIFLQTVPIVAIAPLNHQLVLATAFRAWCWCRASSACSRSSPMGRPG